MDERRYGGEIREDKKPTRTIGMTASEAQEVEETLDDFIISNDENPLDLDTRMDALDDPFSFGDDDF